MGEEETLVAKGGAGCQDRPRRDNHVPEEGGEPMSTAQVPTRRLKSIRLVSGRNSKPTDLGLFPSSGSHFRRSTFSVPVLPRVQRRVYFFRLDISLSSFEARLF